MATRFVNKHITRVVSGGGTVPDPAWLATIDSWLTSNSLYPRLFDWTDPAIGVQKDGSNNIVKMMGLGTTWLPRLGDLTPNTFTSVTYNATVINGFPGWVGTVGTAYSYYGTARAGSIRTNNMRKLYRNGDGITVIGVYNKTNTFTASLFGTGQNGGVYLQNTSGTAGTCKVMAGKPGTGSFSSTQHAVTLANSHTNIIGLTWDQFNGLLTPFVEGSAGTPITYTALPYQPGLGQVGETSAQYGGYVTGSSTATSPLVTNGTTPSIAGTANEAQFNCGCLVIFTAPLSNTLMASFNTLIRARIGP